MGPLSGWGRHPVVLANEIRSEDLELATRSAQLTRGLGRSYGDACLPLAGETVVASPPANRFLAFDGETGVLRTESGVSLEEIYHLLLPRGWFVPVSPGTKFVTVGGMVAADVHGKNHHVSGTFGRHVRALRMRVADGRIIDCSPLVERDLFRATLGGMGLTGHILEVEFQMDRIPSPWIWGEREGVRDIDGFLEALARSAGDWPFTAGWIDCVSGKANLGRGYISRGRWAEPHEAPATPPPPKRRIRIPTLLPNWTLNRATVWAFNAVYYRLNKRRRVGIMHPDEFFYPLDAIHGWHAVYGRAGFTQYQCVIPDEVGHAAVRRFMELVVARGGASPLCVIKDCGDEDQGLLSFPKPGISIAIDFPVRSWTQGLVDALNEMIISLGGRIYLAKDALTRREHFARMEPRLARWREVRRRWDPQGKLRSSLSARLLDDEP